MLNLPTKIIIFILCCLVFALIGSILCDIDKYEHYKWYSGIWHGLFFPENWVRSWFVDTLYKARHSSTGYNVCWCITLIVSLPTNIAYFIILFHLLNIVLGTLYYYVMYFVKKHMR